jgi:hypothetical protein
MTGNTAAANGIPKSNQPVARMTIPGKPTPLMWFMMCTCTPLAIASIACQFFVTVHWILQIAIWSLGGTFAAVSGVTIVWAVCEMIYNKNLASRSNNKSHL